MKAYLLLHTAPYLLLMTAACWHAIGIGTQGLRGRIVHSLTGAGMLWGLLTPPWGWVELGGAASTIVFIRYAATPDGRLFLLAAGELLWRVTDTALCLLGRTFRWVLSPGAHKAPPAEQSREVPRHRDTLGSQMASTPPASLFEPEDWKRGTAAMASVTPILTPVDTYADIIGSVVGGHFGFNDGYRRAEKNFGVSRSKYARDIRAAREEAA